MFDLNDMAERVASSITASLWTLCMAILDGIGWGTILLTIGALLAFVLSVRLFFKLTLRGTVIALLLILGGIGLHLSGLLDGQRRAEAIAAGLQRLMPGEDARRLDKVREFNQPIHGE